MSFLCLCNNFSSVVHIAIYNNSDNNKIIKSFFLSREYIKQKDKKGRLIAIKNKNTNIKRDRNNHMILTAESELIRIIKHLSERNQIIKDRDYIPDILSLKVGRSYSTYRETMAKTGMIVTYNGIKYKRIIESSSHSRTQLRENKIVGLYKNFDGFKKIGVMI